MKKQQLLEREKACDEAVLRAGILQQNYAQHLVNIAKQLVGKTPMISENALPMAKVSQTKARILAILKFDQQKFRFSKWKQWNWGLFYACLFPVLAAFSPVREIIQEQFNLPELGGIKHLLSTEKASTLMLPINFEVNDQRIKEENEQEEKEFGQSNILDANRELMVENLPIHLLTKPNEFLPINEVITKITIPKNYQKTGLFGKWKVGKSEFRIWTYGAFKIIPTPPYVEVVDTSGIVFIEEYIPGLFRDRMNQLAIGKAPIDGRMKVGYKEKLNLHPSALIIKGTPIKAWSDNTNYERWMATKGKRLPKYLLKKQEEKIIKEATAENSEWKKKIEGAKRWLKYHFIPEEKILKQVKIENRRLVFELGKIPYKGLDLPQENLVIGKIGKTTLSHSTIGNMSTNPKDIKYITLLKGNKRPALVKDFNFHLAENDFKNVKFSLQLYNVANGEIEYAITKHPIPITLKADEKGWIKMDLSTYDIVTKGDVLVVLTNNGFSGTKNRKKLYFSLAEDYQNYQRLLIERSSWKTKIWEEAFIMYLSVEQNVDGIGKIERKENKGNINNNVAANKPNNTLVDLSARKIVETAIDRLKDNYIQKPYNADLFFRYSSLNQADSLGYQSEALLKFYDSAGYQKRGWRNAASTRHIKLEQGQILVGKQADKMELEELGRIFFFWTHEPIITRDKPLSESSIHAYDFKLVDTKVYEGKNVWEIEFVCTKLKDRFAGLPSLKYMKGKFYINQADYAVLEYQQQYLMDYEWKGKHPEKRGHLKERNIIESSRIEKFSKNKDGYYLDYAKIVSNNESQNTLLDGEKDIHKGKFIEEQQYFNLTTENVEPLNKNLNNLNKEITYNPDFWEQFNIVLNGQ